MGGSLSGVLFRCERVETPVARNSIAWTSNPGPGFGTDPGKAFPGNVRFLIDSRTGRDVSAYSGAPEAEVLFDRDTVFEVLKTTTDEKGKTVIYLAEVP